MQRSPLKQEHINRLSDYDIPNIVVNDAIVLKFKTGEAIVREGIPMEYLLIVMRGKAKVCVSAVNGKHLILCYYVSKGILGDVEMMTNSYIATTSVIAISEFECVALPYCRVAKRLQKNIPFLNKLGKELSAKLINSSNSCLYSNLHSGEERLCAYILQTSHNGIFVDPLMDVAGSIGISYRHLLRMLRQLCIDKILIKAPSGYRILDRDKLIRRAPDFL